jgi:hypothetical protein
LILILIFFFLLIVRTLPLWSRFIYFPLIWDFFLLRNKKKSNQPRSTHSSPYLSAHSFFLPNYYFSPL